MELDPHAHIFLHIDLKQMISNMRMKTCIDALGQYIPKRRKSIRNDEPITCNEDLDSMLSSVL